MGEYNYISDKQASVAYLNKQEILHYVTEEEVFELVFGYKPVEMEYVTSPFREDTRPGAWFERRGDTLRFVDFGSSDGFFHDCFSAVQVGYRIPNFYQTLLFIHKRLIEGRNLTQKVNIVVDSTSLKKERAVINVETRKFAQYDADYWKPYGISKQNLIDDHVFPVRKIMMKNTKKGDYDTKVTYKCYAYTEFEDNRKKLYMPDSSQRFLTNCLASDLGSIKHLPPVGRQLIISKSYKDCRVLRNSGRNVLWLQNEGVIPDFEQFFAIINHFDFIIVLYDNDSVGIRVAKEVRDLINSRFTHFKARALWLPEHMNAKGISDPADLRKLAGPQSLNEFFNHNHI